MTPFLKWVGGKRQLLPELLARVPRSFKSYYEPFVGGGALFWVLSSQWRLKGEASLNDANRELMTTYRAIRDDVSGVLHALQDHALSHSEKYFYRVRGMVGTTPVSTAARTIYLNKTCFNGLYRVNKSGGFNVPFGRYKNPTICDEENLHACSQALKHKVALLEGDFAVHASRAHKGDLVYLDPPYVPLNATSDFTSYTVDGFGDQDQVRLRDLALELKRKGVFVLLSNSSAPRVYNLYKKGFTVEKVEAKRSVNSKASGRGVVKELLIT